jgi:NADP-dependent 3-hydroxy acid dehydrogenase YdfG
MDLSDNITGKIIVITGASSGLGETTARHLASKGANVVLGARREDKLEQIATEINSTGKGKAIYLKTDVTKKDEVQALVDKAVQEFGKLDVIINNAGLMSIAPMSETKVDEWDRMIDVNIKGVLYGIAAALPIFQKQESGHFINLSSAAGVKVFSPGGTVYSGTKFAVSAISEGLRHEVGGNIRTTSIAPGAVESELKHGSSHTESADFVKEFYQSAIPADAIARTIAFAIEQPANVDVNQIVLRPTVQDF